jgi:hypothetical protein
MRKHQEGLSWGVFLWRYLLGQQSLRQPQRQRRLGTAWPKVPTEHRVPPLVSFWKEPSQSHCAGAYTAAVALVAQSHGAGRTRPPHHKTRNRSLIDASWMNAR